MCISTSHLKGRTRKQYLFLKIHLQNVHCLYFMKHIIA